MNYYEFLDFLSGKGFKYLSSGLYGRVNMIPCCDDKVLKVDRDYSDTDHDGWPDYILWATKNGYSGSKSPKVYSFKVYDGFYAAIMERLYPLNLDNTCKVNTFVHLSGFVTNYTPDEWKDFTEKLTEYKGAIDASFDMHLSNWMQRANGELVLTDPFAMASSATVVRSDRIKLGTIYLPTQPVTAPVAMAMATVA